jgi:hypothetical protein
MNMTQGGIFNGPTALGFVGTGSGVACEPSNTALVRKVQAYLKDNGAPNLKVDGSWQGCTASAFKKIFGRPYVTADDIYKMTGETCKSANTFLGGVIPAFTLSSINVCNDGSDGVAAGGGGTVGAPPQQCPAGQNWSALVQTCVPDPFNLLGPGGGAATPQAQQCPSGQVWNEMLKTCLPGLPGQTNGGGGGVVAPPSECPAGTYKNPLDPTQCLGPGGVTPATECPQGMSKVGGQCVAGPGGDLVSGIMGTIGNLLGGGAGQPGTTQPGQPAPGAGLNELIAGVTGAIGNLFGAGAGAGGCAPGLTFNPVTGQCVGPGGVSVPPGWTTPTTPGTVPGESPWGTMGYVLAGLLGIGAVAGLTYGVYYFSTKDEFDDLTDEEKLLIDTAAAEDWRGAQFEAMGGDDSYSYVANRRHRRRRKGKKSRRRGWRRRRRVTRRRRKSSRRRRRWSRR